MRILIRGPLALVMMLCYSRVLTSRNQRYEPFCLHTSSVLGGTQCSFLQRSAATESLLFYWSVWTAELDVAECWVSAEADLVQNYMTLCGEARTWDSNGRQSLHLNVSRLSGPGSPCEFRPNTGGSLMRYRMNVDTGHQARAKIRRKRAWIFPGTLWCGHGSTAGNYEQLGMFEHVDRCCREHDHCAYMIRPFTVSFGVLNPSPFTISHCDCDHRFKQCLLSVNDTVSNMVGYTFFNILKLRCFDLIQKRRCTQLNWFGMCSLVEVAPFAVLKSPIPYNLSNANLTASGISDTPHYQLQPSANGKGKKNKPKQRNQSKTQKRIHQAALAREGVPFLKERMQQHYVKTKKLSPRTTIFPSVWKNATTSKSITINNTTFFHQKNQTIIKGRTLSIRKSKFKPVHLTTSSPEPTKITHTHAKTSQTKKRFNTQIPVVTPLTNRRKATTTQNATLQIKMGQTFHKPLKSKHNCDYKVPQRDHNFQSTQEKGKESKVDDGSGLKSFRATMSPKCLSTPLANIFPRTGKLFVNQTQIIGKKARIGKNGNFSSRSSALNKNTVSSRSQRRASSGPTKASLTSTMKTTHPKQEFKCSHSKNKSATVTKRPKIRNPTPAKFMATTKPKSTLWKDIVLPSKTTLLVNASLLTSCKSVKFKNSSTIGRKEALSSELDINAKKRYKPPKTSYTVNNAFKNMTSTSRPTTPKENPTVPQQETVSSNETTKSLSYSLQKEKNSTKETTGYSSICDAFRYLDRCKYRIGPMEKMYGHHNKESTTMYHCDCIHRFTANLKQLKKANTLQFLLGKFVSLSCIEISNIKECHKTTSCPVIISKTTKLDASLKKMEDAQATAKHIKQLANKRTPRQLHKYCLRILNPRNTKHGKKKLL